MAGSVILLGIRNVLIKSKIKKWQCPDWRNIEEYPNMEEASLHQWYWQFLRRREDYQIAFYEYLEDLWNKYNEAKEIGHPWSNNPDHWAYTYAIQEIMDKFSILKTPNPSDDYPSRFKYKFQNTWDTGKFNEEPEKREYEVRENDFLCFFDLDLPIEQQLIQAKEWFLRSQEAYNFTKNGERKSTKQLKRKTSLWMTYLRVLDARNNNIKYKDIYLTLKTEKLIDDIDEYDRLCNLETTVLTKRGEKQHKAALDIQFNFPFK